MRKSTSVSLAALAVLFACASTACTGGGDLDQGPSGTGSSSGSSSGVADGGGTRVRDPAGLSYSLESLDEACDGVATTTGRALVDKVPASSTATLTWSADATTEDVELRFGYEGGAIVCHRAQEPANGGDGPSIKAYVDVDFALDVKTATGSLDERLVVTVSGQRLTNIVGETLSLAFTGVGDLAALRGTYTPDPRFTSMTVSGGVSPGGVQGNVALHEQPQGAGAREQVATFESPL